MPCADCQRWNNRAHELNRRARRQGRDGRVRADQLVHRVVSCGFRCHWCGRGLNFDAPKHRTLSWGAATFDHLVPLDRGGNGSVANLVPACHACNKLRAMLDGSPMHSVRSFAGLAGRLDVLEALTLKVGSA